MARRVLHSPRPAATIKDVAAAAGVSVTTVSHVLNGKGRVDPATRETVRAAARRLGYRPNRSAQSLRLGRTGAIGLLLPHLADLSWQEVLTSDWYIHVSMSVARAAFGRDKALLLLPIDETPDRFIPMVDGVIVIDAFEADPRVAALDRAGAAAVTFNGRDPSRPGSRYVLPDLRSGVAAVLDHMAAQGAHSIAALYADIAWPPLLESFEAYRAWMAANGLAERLAPVDMSAAANAEALHESAYRSAQRVLAGPDRPDAIIALFAGFGSDALRAARELGLDCPGDVLIAQDLEGARERAATPPITTIDLRPDLQAAAAVDMLLKILDGEEPDVPILTAVDVNLRASTARS